MMSKNLPAAASPLFPPLDRLDWTAVSTWRRNWRKQLLEGRAGVAPTARRRTAAKVQSILEHEMPELRGKTLGLYWPFRGEIDLRELAANCSEPIQEFALPVVVGKGMPLEFWRWWTGMQLARGVWGITVPAVREVVEPAALLVPLLGFDEDGYRLGYGGGYYDRTLAVARPRPLTVGVGYTAGRLETICPQSHDIPMDVIVTETGITDFRARRRIAANDPASAEQVLSAPRSSAPVDGT